MKYGAVIAAAGLSSRMHEFKPLMCLGDSTVIENVIGGLKKAGVEEIVVVAGYKADILKRHLENLDVKVCVNEKYAETKMLDSLKFGIENMESDYDYLFLTPGDVPLVKPETMIAMKKVEKNIVRPAYSERYGHPVLMSRKIISNLMEYHGDDGLRGIIKKYEDELYNLKVDDVGVIMDADTPDDFKALRKQAMKVRSSGKLWPDIRIHISKGDTILTPETAQFLEMIEHTGSIQGACACMHKSYSSGWRRLNQMEEELGYALVERFPGGVSGGGSTLTEKGKRLLKAYQEFQNELREISEKLFNEKFSEELK